MTNERAKSELEQLYMSLSEEKKKALDVAFKAMEQSMPTMVYPQVDGITPTVVAQADGEKNCFNCKWYPDNDITKGFDEVCHKCSNSDKWEGLIKRVPWEDIAPPPKIPEAQADGEKTCGTCRNEDTYHCAECENKSDYEQSQADGEYILKKDVMGCIGQTSVHSELARKLRELPSVAIPPEHDGCKDCKYETYPEYYYPCCECKQNYKDEWERAKIGHWIWQTEDIYQCSECGEDIHVKEVMNKPQYICCPICGCLMESER